MSVLLPVIGTTICSRAKNLLENCTEDIIGSFWVMAGYGFDKTTHPEWWSELEYEDNQAELIINAFKKGKFNGEHNNPLYLGFCIIVVKEDSSPVSFSYVIQHLRMYEGEGIGLLKFMTQNNIVAQVVTYGFYPERFLSQRFGTGSKTYEFLSLDILHWSSQIWEEYCNYLMLECGGKILREYWERLKKSKN